MSKDPTLQESGTLQAFRQEIDALDERIIQLLIERTKVVMKVGSLKENEAPGRCPIRPGREAEQLRRISASVKNTDVLPEAAAAIWRFIIGMSASIERELKISAYAPSGNTDLFWLAREYFGPFLAVTKQPQIKRVIGDVMDGNAAVGILPMPLATDTEAWWTALTQHGKEAPKIFAHVPFVYTDSPGRAAPAALAIAHIAPEPTGDDLSLVAFTTEHDISQHKLQTAFTKAGLEAKWISIINPSPDTRQHLIEIKGFVTPEEEALASSLKELGRSIIAAKFLGAYARPLTFPAAVKKAEYAPAHS